MESIKSNDLNIILTDNNDEISFSVDGKHLQSKSIFFRTKYPSLVDISKIILQVPYVNISFDIIMSFFGIKINNTKLEKWEYLLKSIICNKLFMIDIDYSQLYQIKIPENGLTLFNQILPLIEKEIDVENLKKNILPIQSDDLTNSIKFNTKQSTDDTILFFSKKMVIFIQKKLMVIKYYYLVMNF